MMSKLPRKHTKKPLRKINPNLLLVILSFFLFLEGRVTGVSSVLPPLQIDPQVLDFGRINEFVHILELSFAIKNVSNASVEIANISSGCGCTTASLSQRTLKSGETISVPVKIVVSGQRGNFEKNIQINVVGGKEPIIVPIQGIIVQDIWFDGPMVQCFAKEAGTTVEKTFEVRTVDWHSVQFDWKLVDRDLRVEEISRVKENDETVITFRVRMEVPLDQSTVSRHLVLAPLDKRIKQLIVPIVCYRALSQSARSELLARIKNKNVENFTSTPELQPRRVNLGLIPYGEEQRFDISCAPELLESMKVTSLERFPQGTEVILLNSDALNKSVPRIVVRVGASLKSGLFKGTIWLQSAQDYKFSIDVIGFVGPSNKE